jgi:transglutaminase-like putative cysteine protease
MAGAYVGCDLLLEASTPASVVLSIAPATGAGVLDVEGLTVTCDDLDFFATTRHLTSVHGTRLHVMSLPAGRIGIHYEAHVEVAEEEHTTEPPDEVELLVYRRPSRFCPSDRLVGLASAELDHVPLGQPRLDALVLWVARRLAYVVGSSGPLDTAVETLLAGQGVCRDYAHLMVAMARALDMPARFASVYAPGLFPMDFHAVAEVWVGGRWNAIDATYLAPRQSLVRIATGRDAADTAFVTTLEGEVELLDVVVKASVDADLPRDTYTDVVTLR